MDTRSGGGARTLDPPAPTNGFAPLTRRPKRARPLDRGDESADGAMVGQALTHRPMHVETFAAGPLGCNCSIVADTTAKRAIVIDPGGDLDVLRARLDALGCTVDAIVHTHTHVDHVGETASLQKLTGARACIHEGDRFLYDLLPVQSVFLGIAPPAKADMEGSLVDETVLRCGDVELAVLHTPGHTPGSCCFLAKHGDDARLFAGDTLFRGSIGRTDLWGGDGELILRSLRDRVLALPDPTIVVAGHGPDTSVGAERVGNPFLARFRSRTVTSM